MRRVALFVGSLPLSYLICELTGIRSAGFELT